MLPIFAVTYNTLGCQYLLSTAHNTMYRATAIDFQKLLDTSIIPQIYHKISYGILDHLLESLYDRTQPSKFMNASLMKFIFNKWSAAEHAAFRVLRFILYVQMTFVKLWLHDPNVTTNLFAEDAKI